METKNIILAGISAVLLAVCTVGYVYAKRKTGCADSVKPKNMKSRLWFCGVIISAWFLIGVMITAFSGKTMKLGVEFEMFSPRIQFTDSFSLAKTTVIASVTCLILIILLILFRIIFISKFNTDRPTPVQNATEAVYELLEKLVSGAVPGEAVKGLTCYMLSIALFMIGCAFTELFGLRAPTSDLTCTIAMGLVTFFLINLYGIKKGGISGRLKNMGGAVPAMRPLMIPLKAVSDIAIPVSLGCRLFGNMLGGMMVMDLLKGVLGGYASGIPALAGLYFNLFHPMIQMYIFITLSLTFINEAME